MKIMYINRVTIFFNFIFIFLLISYFYIDLDKNKDQSLKIIKDKVIINNIIPIKNSSNIDLEIASGGNCPFSISTRASAINLSNKAASLLSRIRPKLEMIDGIDDTFEPIGKHPQAIASHKVLGNPSVIDA